jgi:pimeloyl-ACP methyl ester carboxylesterase
MKEPLTREVTLSNGLRMRYYEWPGDGPNLVFLHPSSGYGRMWDGTAAALAGRFHVFAPDQRGHGDSDRPDGSYAAEEYAQDLHLFLEQLGLGRAIIAGHSLGGRVAQVFAATYPKHTVAILLVGGPHYSNFFQERQRVEAVLEGVQTMRASRTEFPSAQAALEYLRQLRPADSEETRRHRLEHNTRPLERGGVAFKYDKVRVAQGLTHLADDLRPYAQRVSCPVVILRGSRSTHLTREEAECVARFWKDCRVVEVEGDYSLEMENPDGLARAIRDFSRAATGV